MKTFKTALSALAILAVAGPALASDFSAMDVNTDGQVSFDEYKTVAQAEGKTVTLAAQEFTRMAQGDAILTQDEFFLAAAVSDQPYALQTGLVSAPETGVAAEAPYEPMEIVETFETSPNAVEMVEPPLAVEDVPDIEVLQDNPAPILMEKPLEIDPLVAGEIETSADTALKAPGDSGFTEITPLEDVETELSTPSPEEQADALNEDIESEGDLVTDTPEAEDEDPDNID